MLCMLAVPYALLSDFVVLDIDKMKDWWRGRDDKRCLLRLVDDHRVGEVMERMRAQEPLGISNQSQNPHTKEPSVAIGMNPAARPIRAARAHVDTSLGNTHNKPFDNCLYRTGLNVSTEI